MPGSELKFHDRRLCSKTKLEACPLLLPSFTFRKGFAGVSMQNSFVSMHNMHKNKEYQIVTEFKTLTPFQKKKRMRGHIARGNFFVCWIYLKTEIIEIWYMFWSCCDVVCCLKVFQNVLKWSFRFVFKYLKLSRKNLEKLKQRERWHRNHKRMSKFWSNTRNHIHKMRKINKSECVFLYVICIWWADERILRLTICIYMFITDFPWSYKTDNTYYNWHCSQTFNQAI